jgi:hypothetical protein
MAAQNRGPFVHVEQAHVKRQQLAQAARTHHTQHGGGADIVFPAVQGVAHELRQSLWQRGISKNTQRANALCAQSITWAGRHVFQGLGKQAAQNATGVQGQCQSAGHGPQAGRT